MLWLGLGPSQLIPPSRWGWEGGGGSVEIPPSQPSPVLARSTPLPSPSELLVHDSQSRSRNSGGLRRKRIRSRSPCRRIETVLARLRLGHTNVTHVYLMQGQTEPPECDRCRVTIIVKHLLLECRKYVTIRNKYFRNPTQSDMLAESNDFSIDKLVLYLKEANLFHQI